MVLLGRLPTSDGANGIVIYKRCGFAFIQIVLGGETNITLPTGNSYKQLCVIPEKYRSKYWVHFSGKTPGNTYTQMYYINPDTGALMVNSNGEGNVYARASACYPILN